MPRRVSQRAACYTATSSQDVSLDAAGRRLNAAHLGFGLHVPQGCPLPP